MSKTPPPPATGKAQAFARLRQYANQIAQDPQTNSVMRLGEAYFFALSDGRISLDALSRLTRSIGREFFDQRANALAAQHGHPHAKPWADCQNQIETAAKEGFATFSKLATAAMGGMVFTAHPTFAHTRPIRAALAKAACGEPPASGFDPLVHEAITLDREHEDAQDAIHRAQIAQFTYLETMYRIAAEQFPDQWQSLNIEAPSIASWVGYDLDGRDDINWWTTLGYRLAEKATQLSRYASALDDLGLLPEISQKLYRASTLAQQQSAAFKQDLRDPDKLVLAANLLTEAHDDHLVSLHDVIAAIRTHALALTSPKSIALHALAAQMQQLGLGTARIHLRINAAQVQTVIRRDLGVVTEDRQLGRVALETLAEKFGETAPFQINFADLFLEQATARRQFMLCAQILKHIDADTPIRFLIAESENPATVLGALYIASQYGVDGMMDISPLFETPKALGNGARYVDKLLRVPAFADYVARRGQLSIQLGFSDAGRFIGQISADMAIERLHNLIAKALSRAMPGTRLLVFNTHGESIGRGGYPGTFRQRLAHLLSPWTRARCAKLGIPVVQETSFQGGDGYVHFGTQILADSSLAHIAAHALAPSQPIDDPFYTETSLVWDFYGDLRNWQENLFNNADYAVLLGDFAGGFRLHAGSRPQQRVGRVSGPRALRAISHNATLQQLASLANTACGFGTAMQIQDDDFVDLVNTSPRMRSLMDMAIYARMHTSLPALRAYAETHSPSFWVAASKQVNDHRAHARARIALALRSRTTHSAMMNCADHFSLDLGRFDPLIARIDHAPSTKVRHEERLKLHTLHAIRIGVMLRAMEIAGELPAISAKHGFRIDDVQDLILQMRIGEAVELLERHFPRAAHEYEQLVNLSEPRFASDDLSERDFTRLQDELVRPLQAAHQLIVRVSLAIAHAHNAWG